jgi:histone deacetylase 6
MKQSNAIKPYIDWAIRNGFAVMDVCLPQQLPKDGLGEIIDSYTPKSSEHVVTMQCKELIIYLWENWLELIGNTSITLMGVGDANLGIKQLLQAKGTFPLQILEFSQEQQLTSYLQTSSATKSPP